MIENSFFIPKNFTTSIVKNKIFIIVLVNSVIRILVPLSIKTKFNRNTNVICYVTNYKLNLLSSFFRSLSVVNLQIIKFKGKGYKLTRKHKIIDFLFNFSHINYLVLRDTVVRKITKNKICLINQNDCNLKKTSVGIFRSRPVNMYTYNGFRLKRQMISKRKGKTISN